MRTDIGHFSISYDGHDYELYPTFKNMRKLCEPNQMPDFFAGLFGELVKNTVSKNAELRNTVAAAIGKKLVYRDINKIYEDAAFVIQCCCDDDTSKLTGSPSYAGGRKTWRAGVINHENMLHVARSLMVHGVAGRFDPDRRGKKGKATDSIDVYHYVELAMAHLGMSYAEAEQLTKTEFDRLIDAKYPDAKRGGNNAPTLSEHEEAMAWLDKVNAKRDAKKGAK